MQEITEGAGSFGDRPRFGGPGREEPRGFSPGGERRKHHPQAHPFMVVAAPKPLWFYFFQRADAPFAHLFGEPHLKDLGIAGQVMSAAVLGVHVPGDPGNGVI